VALGLLSAGHPQRTRDTWIDTCVLTNQAHKWRLGSSSVLGKPQRTRGSWGALGVSHAYAPLRNTYSLGHGARPRFLGLRILNIIVCFRNIIIIIIIIIIINEIINKFERKYYY
jgi:hypothetical protein